MLAVHMALFSSKLPSFVIIIITELSKHDLGELVGKGERQRKRNCEPN